ncbi:MAG TPA: KEOPS complex subunit Pcc1 [archaeon]|jgi:tRNA threonylcarbamoyladenosine modification (KEOPS) complex  Pcc1 subunit|nr:KEOPS complex subunit Pcc1 [archaeon]
MIGKIISSSLVIETKNPKKLKELLELELTRKKYDRSESKIKISKKQLIIDIECKDIVAYKATINHYINLLELIKKTYEVDL